MCVFTSLMTCESVMRRALTEFFILLSKIMTLDNRKAGKQQIRQFKESFLLDLIDRLLKISSLSHNFTVGAGKFKKDKIRQNFKKPNAYLFTRGALLEWFDLSFVCFCFSKRGKCCNANKSHMMGRDGYVLQIRTSRNEGLLFIQKNLKMLQIRIEPLLQDAPIRIEHGMQRIA